MNECWENDGDSGNINKKDFLDCSRIIYLAKKYENIELAKMVVDLENENNKLIDVIVKIGKEKQGERG